MAGQHPVIDLILEQRELTKLNSTYVDALPRLVNPRTGRLHTSYNQAGAVTGRISSSDPNLQNIPVRTPIGRQVRRAFVAAPGWQLVAADYSQVELRIMAHISGDAGLLSAFARGEDIHASTAAAILGVPLSEVTPDAAAGQGGELRPLYGQTAYGLAQATGLTQAEAENFIQAYFERFPKVRALHRPDESAGHAPGVRRDAAGTPALLSRATAGPRQADHNVRQAAERVAINAPIQGTAADIIKIAMIRLQSDPPGARGCGRA